MMSRTFTPDGHKPTNNNDFSGMSDTEILQNLARSGRLAARTQKRALTRSLLNKALDCRLVHDTQARPHLTDTRYGSSRQEQRYHGYHDRYKLRDFTSNSPTYEDQRGNHPENCVYCKTINDQQYMQMVDSHQDQEKHDDSHYIRKGSDQIPDEHHIFLGANNGQKHVETHDDLIFFKKKSSLHDVTTDYARDYVIKEIDHKYGTEEKCCQCTKADVNHERDEYQYVRENDPHRHTRSGGGWQLTGKDNLHFREIDDGQQHEESISNDEERKDHQLLPEQSEDYPDKKETEEQPEEPDIDTTMRNMAEMMNNISHLCECYYDSCPKGTLSHTEKRHLRAFHKGVLPIKTSAQQKKVLGKSKENMENSASLSSCLSSEVRSHGVRFTDASIALDAKLDHINKNAHYSEATDRLHDTYNYASPLSKFESHRSSRASDVYSDQILPTGWTESETDTLIHSNKGPSEDTLYPFYTNSSSCVSFEAKLKRNLGKTGKSHLDAHQKAKESVTGVSLSKNCFVEGISAFPTDNIRFQPKSSKVQQKATKSNSGQGIYLTTKPGTYIVRKPQKKSSIHLLQVNPGNYIKFNM